MRSPPSPAVRARRLAALVLALAAIGSGTPAAARAAGECRGLPVCLPVAGPWVVVPGRDRGVPVTVEYELRCPLPGYVVAGVDARLADAEIDVSFRGETGSPVGPGVTTRGAALFAAYSTAAASRPSSFRPFIGCVPQRGGGSRSQTAYSASRPPRGVAPTRPTVRVVVTRRLGPGATRISVRCERGSRLLAGAHAVAFRSQAPPPARLLGAVRVVRSTAGGAVVARAVASAALAGARAELQLHAVCRRPAP